MQILVRDIFRLQSLQTAHLIAGREGILRPLCGGTILEMTELGRDNASELLSFSFKPQEIMITALYNVKNDVESQCDVIRALNKLNAAGLIVFYYGLVVQKFDQRVLDLCDELNFPLVVLNYNDNKHISYADVLNDVLSLNRYENDSFFRSIISSMWKTKDSGGSIQEVLSQIANQGELDIVIIDTLAQNALCSTMSGNRLNTFLNNELSRLPFDASRFELLIDETKYCGRHYYTDYLELSVLFVLSQRRKRVDIDSLFTCTKLCLDLWRHALVSTRGGNIINAIIRGDWQQAHSDLGYYRHGDAEQWNFLICSRAPSLPLMHEVKSLLQSEGIAFINGGYEQLEILIFNRAPDPDAEALNALVLSAQAAQDPAGHFACATNISGESELFSLVSETAKEWAFTCSLYKNRYCMGRFELIEAIACKQDLRNEAAIDRARQILDPLIEYDRRREGVLLETLQIYLIDCDCSYKQTAALTYTHQNTVQYRVRKAMSLLGGNFEQAAALSAVFTRSASIGKIHKYSRNYATMIKQNVLKTKRDPVFCFQNIFLLFKACYHNITFN